MTQGAAAVGGLMLLLQLPAVAQTNIWKKVRQPIKNMEMKQALLIEKKDFTENYSRKITSAQKNDCFLVLLHHGFIELRAVQIQHFDFDLL